MTKLDVRPQRFTAPALPVSVTRLRHSGLGTTGSEEIPATQDKTVHALETLPPEEGFTGIRSRSRFRFVPSVPVGHGSAARSVDQPTRGKDPAAGVSNFDDLNSNFPPSLGEVPHRSEYDVSLGQTGPRLVRDHILNYIRRSVDVRSGGTHPEDQIRWSDAGPVPKAKLHLRFTLRREFMQDAQNFSGLRMVQGRAAHVSTSPVRMTAARTNRLTVRDLPRSFGARTEVVQ